MVRKVLVAVLMMFVACGTAAADVPQLLNYQGKLNDADGAPIEGEVTVGFDFYDAEADGNPLYSEEQTVTCAKGVFTVLIGNGSNPKGDFAGIYAGDSVWFEITVDPQGDAQVLTPRQRIASTVFALKAGTADGLAELMARVFELERKLERVQVSETGDDITISGANLHIVNGTGMTDGDVNGLGNLIVGYNEVRDAGDNDRSGSHNIIVGRENNFSSHGGFVAGAKNTVSGAYATVSGGWQNTANGDYASVSGGRTNSASGEYASVSGGFRNPASGQYASVSGGIHNKASGIAASVSGGRGNLASGYCSSVAGGGGLYESLDGNNAFGDYSAILGGTQNITGDPALTDHTVGQHSTVSGGHSNSVSGEYGAVSGGRSNTASGDYASVSGGRDNTASGTVANVGGGYQNTASGLMSSVSGGRENVATGTCSTVSGGQNHTAGTDNDHKP